MKTALLLLLIFTLPSLLKVSHANEGTDGPGNATPPKNSQPLDCEIGNFGGCVYAVKNSEGKILSSCMSVNHIERGFGQNLMEKLVREGLCKQEYKDQSGKYRFANVFPDKENHCWILSPAADKYNNCVTGVFKESQSVVSTCYSENDYAKGIVHKKLTDLTESRTCSESSLCGLANNDASRLPKGKNLCRLSKDVKDQYHPNGCKYAIVDTCGKIVSNCLSEKEIIFDRTAAPKKGLLNELVERGVCDSPRPRCKGFIECLSKIMEKDINLDVFIFEEILDSNISSSSRGHLKPVDDNLKNQIRNQPATSVGK